MKSISFIIITFLGINLGLHAQSTTYSYKDIYGNSYKKYQNLYQDRDGDGVINYYDRHDQNPNIGTNTTPNYSNPGYYNNYSSSYYDASSRRTIYVGPRGGRYYINSNGNKTYIRD